MTNIFIRIPKVGDIVVGELSTKKISFIDKETFDSASLGEDYEVQGVVGARYGNKVLIVGKDQKSLAWCDHYMYKLSGFTLDGSDHQMVLRIPVSGSTTNDFTITYNATTLDGIASQLNAFFASNDVFVTQQWAAYAESDKVRVELLYTFRQQASYVSCPSGAISISSALFPEITASSRMPRKNGVQSGEGAISSLDRAIQYFRSDNTSTTYNPANKQNSLKTTYPICLPCYLGTSAYNNPSTEKCAVLREFYGEGEDGWLRYMKANALVPGTDAGQAMDDVDIYANTQALASALNGSGTKICKAANYCAEYATQCLSKGEWALPSPKHLADILKNVQSPVNNTGGGNILGEAMALIGGVALSNGAGLWSCSRYSANTAWYAGGAGGYFVGGGYMCYTNGVRPVSLYILES